MPSSFPTPAPKQPLSRASQRPGALKRLSRLASLGLGLAAASCGPTEDDKPNPPDPDYTHPLAENTPICGRSDFNEMFPYSIRSTTLPVLVHYYKESERETAQQVLGFVEKGWDYHVNQLGMRQAITDAGECGPDESFDVFVWKGHRSCLVNVLSGEPTTAWDDRRGYMIVDPWGPYGGVELEETVVHEMAHASQAADDWYESPITFEMSAVFTDQVYANRYIKTYFDDFQAHPDWALDRYDEYETWYMYGSSMYLLFLKDRFFGGDARFLSSMWLASRNPPGAGEDQTLNDPDFADALDTLLASHGSSYVQSVPEFSRWRWYTGDHVDDKHFRHFKDGLENLRAARLALAAQQEARPGKIDIGENAPMMLGTSYLELSAGAGTPGTLYVSLEAPSDASRRFIVQAVPGLTPDSDGEVLDLSTGPKELKFAADQKRTLIVTVVPTGDYDPDLRTEDRHPFSIVLAAHP
ncbi:hypothetical protein D187_009167 [Cystobacter fuscus DSM 2262]|uniref:Uncharacterized protein n=1 Tax=Cystobacter fuscus (strain ATCC 25194 / DSM 2262 / NBRC 100088 / M29) TaxID=1242864 RepID=S9NXG0_CYSF2|nr:hypothetical protein [Cystobacter fuscus]EPX55556.1 hypothetical protein D187_009167 [Cystobacter fuscus DSM 2262]